jgi:hypothetical protein
MNEQSWTDHPRIRAWLQERDALFLPETSGMSGAARAVIPRERKPLAPGES